jgi:hypothetical protein
MTGRTQKVLLAVACCFVLVLLPFSTALGQEGLLKGAKEGVQKGAEGVQKGAEAVVDTTKKGAKAVGKGAETAVDKTKEGAKAVGKGAKDLVTDEDKDTDRDEVMTNRTKSGATRSGTTVSTPSSRTTTPGTTSSEAAGGASRSTRDTGTEKRELPSTAGELQFLALAGVIALAGAGALKGVRRTKVR